jgi:signal transduction histidine kinase
MNFNSFGSPQLQFNVIGSASGLAAIAANSATLESFPNTAYAGSTSPLDVHSKARFAERKRIAQELHDTLLQGFFAVSMQLHAAVDQLRADTAVKPKFNSVLQVMDRVLEEGRRAVQGLRSTSASDGFPSLGQALATVPNDLGLSSAIGFRVIVEGRERELKAELLDELYLVGREAIVNAYRHSGAQGIEVEIEYRPKGLRIVVRDNGRGIAPQVLRAERDGHWGLSGMKERTQRIGGQLKVLSRAGAGTEVEISVPARMAFEVRPGEFTAG